MIINNFIIDHAKRGTMFSTASTNAGEALWSLTQITNPGLNVTTDSVDAVDNMGNRIATIERQKNVEFTAENAIFDMGLFAAQSGTTIEESTSQNTFAVPAFEEITLTSATSITLAHTPVEDSIPYIYKLNGDGSLGSKFEKASAAAAGKFSITTNTITLFSGDAEVGDVFYIPYNYTANATSGSQATRVVNTAENFPTTGRFVLEVLGFDVCDQSTQRAAMLVINPAKLMGDISVNFTTESTQNFTIRALQNYCDPDKKLYELIILE